MKCTKTLTRNKNLLKTTLACDINNPGVAEVATEKLIANSAP